MEDAAEPAPNPRGGTEKLVPYSDSEGEDKEGKKEESDQFNSTNEVDNIKEKIFTKRILDQKIVSCDELLR